MCIRDRLQWNVDGIATSLTDLQDLVRKKPAVGVVLVQESKLLSSDSDPSVPGFLTVRLDHPPCQWVDEGGWPANICAAGHPLPSSPVLP